jgi:cytochrome c peroxidase
MGPTTSLATAVAAVLALSGALAWSRGFAPSPASAGARALPRSVQAAVDAGPPAPRGIAGSSDGDARRRAAIGRAIFFDPALSEPPGTSCASCHDPAHGYAGDNGATLGTARGSRPGHFSKRASPSVLYLRFVRKFHFRWEEDEPLPSPYGGFFWDGRADTLAGLVRQPLLHPDEMGNATPAAIFAKVLPRPYAADLRREFGAPLDEPEGALKALGEAVEAFLLGPEMSPFSSKFDDYLRGTATLSPEEARGLALFKEPTKGGCEGCHKMSERSPNPERSLFTDFGYDAVGAPRNRLLPDNRDPAHYDRGLCDRHEAASHTDDERLCGSFRTPSLRNVALRTRFLHNGVFSKLRDVVAFYATRDTDPARWYRAGESFDDVPRADRAYVNVTSPPYNQRRGQRPVLDDADIDALVAFLGTLTDTAIH